MRLVNVEIGVRMAGTTTTQDRNFFDNLQATYPSKPTISGTGTMTFAGNLWPPLQIMFTPPAPTGGGLPPPPYLKRNPGAAFKRSDAETAVKEARAMIVPALLAATGAVSGANSDAVPLMTKWFGARPAPPARDWWQGVVTILGVIEAFITGSIHLHYRGDDSLIGKPNDYPGKTGNLTSQDVAGYAETYSGTMNKIIGLCKVFFAKQVGTGQSRMNLRGFDSVGGTLIHELSHNLCRTKDHEHNGSKMYGTADCINLAISRARRAWYNADNIEYFCEELYYGVVTTTVVTTGAAQGVGALAGGIGTAPVTTPIVHTPVNTGEGLQARLARLRQAGLL